MIPFSISPLISKTHLIFSSDSMACRRYLLVVVLSASIWVSYACSDGKCQAGEMCSSDGDCQTGLYCSACFSPSDPSPPRCVRETASNPFKLVNTSLPFNKYAFLTTHNSFAIEGEERRTGPRFTFTNQEDNITQQLLNGVRAFMLDIYDFEGDVWLCHSFEGHCFDFTTFAPAVETLKEIDRFLASNPTEIVTLILEDYVASPNGLTRVLNASGLSGYLLPLSHMPTRPGQQDWPLVAHMLANNHRLLLFTSVKSKQDSEGIAYQWNFMLESHYGDDGMQQGRCGNRGESASMNDTSKSLVLVNYFRSIPIKPLSCSDNSAPNLLNKLQTCFSVAGNRWPNFIAVDYYKRSDGGGVFQALDKLNGQLLCGSDDVHACTIKQ